MNNIEIYKYIRVTQNKVGQRDRPLWLRRLGMVDLVMAMILLSDEYGLKWADDWYDFLDDPRWLKKAMVNTYNRLNDEDKAIVSPLYEDWSWCAANLELDAMVDLGYAAEVYLLDRDRRRVMADGEYKTILVKLDGESRDKALCQLNRQYHEFKRWWN